MLTILLVSTADTELLAAAASGAGYLTANPARTEPAEVPALAARADLVVLRLLGGRKAWPEGVAALTAAGRPLVALGGEAAPDAELMALSTVPAGVATEALGYLREGGPENLRELARFLSDTVFLTGEGFSPPHPMPPHGLHPLSDSMIVSSSGHIAPISAHDHESASAPVVAVVFYRAHELSGQHRLRGHALRRPGRRRGNPPARLLRLAPLSRRRARRPAKTRARGDHHRARGRRLGAG